MFWSSWFFPSGEKGMLMWETVGKVFLRIHKCFWQVWPTFLCKQIEVERNVWFPFTLFGKPAASLIFILIKFNMGYSRLILLLFAQPKLLLSGKRESGALPAQEHKTCAIGVKFGGAWVAQGCAGRRRGGAGAAQGRRRGRAGAVHGAASLSKLFLNKGGRGSPVTKGYVACVCRFFLQILS